jgi:hypothetical protein
VKETGTYITDLDYSGRPFYMFFLMDEDVISTERRAFNIIDCMTKIGGMLGII